MSDVRGWDWFLYTGNPDGLNTLPAPTLIKVVLDLLFDTQLCATITESSIIVVAGFVMVNVTCTTDMNVLTVSRVLHSFSKVRTLIIPTSAFITLRKSVLKVWTERT